MPIIYNAKYLFNTSLVSFYERRIDSGGLRIDFAVIVLLGLEVDLEPVARRIRKTADKPTP